MSHKRRGAKQKICPSTCRRKTAYPTEADAERDAAALRAISRSRVRVYRCPFCGNYFLTSERFGPRGKRSG